MIEYHRALKGLSPNLGKHILSEPAERLANSRKLWLTSGTPSNQTVVGLGELITIPLPLKVRRVILELPYFGKLPRHFRALSGLTAQKSIYKLRNRTCSLGHAVKIIREHYRATPALIDCLSIGFAVPRKVVQNAFGRNRGMNQSLQYACDADNLRRAYNSDAVDKKTRRRYERNLEFLEFIRACFDAVCLCFQLFRKDGFLPNGNTLRQIYRLKTYLMDKPEVCAASLKTLAGECRAWWFGASKPCHPLVRSLNERQALQFSYIARSLPPPLSGSYDPDELRQGLVDRLTSTPPPEDPHWKPWVRTLLNDYRPERISYYTEPSVSSGIGYTRSKGGHTKAYQDIIMYALGQYFREGYADTPEEIHLLRYFVRPNLSRTGHAVIYTSHPGQYFLNALGCTRVREGVPVTKTIPNSIDNIFVNPINMMEAPFGFDINNKTQQQNYIRPTVVLSEILNQLMVEGSKRIINYIDYTPIEALLAPEKGLKVRIPTAGLTAVQLLQHPLRKALDEILREHPAISQSLGGSVAPGFENTDGPFYSLDLTTATDFHPFWLTRAAYEVLLEVVPDLEPLLEYFDKIFGPKRIIKTPKPAPTIDVSFEEVLVYALHLTPIPEKMKLRPREEVVASLIDFSINYEKWLDSFETIAITTTGQMMGDPTSWPVLPLITMYCCEKAHLSPPITCGDDGVIGGVTPEKKTLFDEAMSSLGGVLSEPKSYVSDHRYLLTEIPYDNHREIPYELLSFWTAPQGGSKGELHWYNLPDCYQGFLLARGRETTRDAQRKGGLWNYTKFYHEWKYAQYLGLPLGAPGFMGGISHPYYPRYPSNTQAWSDHLAQMKVKNLLLYGGLSLVPNQGDKRLSKNVESLWDFFEDKIVASKEGEPVERFLAKLSNPRTITSLYNRGFKSVMHRPNISAIAQKFNRKIQKRIPTKVRCRPWALEQDLRSKKERHIDLPLDAMFRTRNFGFGTHTAPIFAFPAPFLKRYWDARLLRGVGDSFPG